MQNAIFDLSQDCWEVLFISDEKHHSIYNDYW